MQPNDFASITTLPRFLPPPPPAPAPPSDAAAHNATGTVQNLLLGLGVLALTVSAVSLVATNWAHFGASVRGGMLVGLTLLLGGLACCKALQWSWDSDIAPASDKLSRGAKENGRKLGAFLAQAKR